MVLTTSDETFADEEDFAAGDVLRPNSIAVWDIAGAKIASEAPLAEQAGTLTAVDADHVVGFFEYPKLIEVRSGRVVARMDELISGKQTSSIIHQLPLPPLALDPARRRFALATAEEIVVVEAAPAAN